MVIGCLRLSHVSVICRVFIRAKRCRTFGEVSCTEYTDQGNNFQLIPTVKMKTRNPVEGYFGSEYPAICNHCGIMAA